jgi:hypothetical protein
MAPPETLSTHIPVLPHRVEHVTERIVDGELVLYDPHRQFVHALNPTAAFVWRACDGDRDEAAIAAGLSQLYPESSEVIERDVRETLDLFVSEGLLSS